MSFDLRLLAAVALAVSSSCTGGNSNASSSEPIPSDISGAAAYERGVASEASKDDPFGALTACRWFHVGAQKGDARAMAEYGRCWLDGTGGGIDYQLALKWLQAAVAAGETGAARYLALMNQLALGIPRDVEKAAAYNRIAAEGGDEVSQYDLARSYSGGHGVERDLRQAEHWFRRSASGGYAPAMYKLARLLEATQRDDRLSAELIELYLDAAAGGSGQAKERLADLYREGEYFSQDLLRARQLYEDVMDTLPGSGVEFKLAQMYLAGEVRREVGIAYLRESAGFGYAPAQLAIARLLADRAESNADLQEAYGWLRYRERWCPNDEEELKKRLRETLSPSELQRIEKQPNPAGWK